MDANTEARFSALVRRIQLVIGRGVLRLVGDAGAVQKVQAEFLAGEVRDSMERVQQYGFTSVPLAGMEVVAAFLGGDRSNGVVIAVGDRQFRLQGLQPGEVALYDDIGHAFHLTREGIVIRGKGHTVTITDIPKLIVEGDLEVTGDILDRAGDGGMTMAGMRETYNAHTHPEPDGTTEPPAQPM